MIKLWLKWTLNTTFIMRGHYLGMVVRNLYFYLLHEKHIVRFTKKLSLLEL